MYYKVNFVFQCLRVDKYLSQKFRQKCISFTCFDNYTLRESSTQQGTYFTLAESMSAKYRKAVFNFKCSVSMTQISRTKFSVFMSDNTAEENRMYKQLQKNYRQKLSHKGFSRKFGQNILRTPKIFPATRVHAGIQNNWSLSFMSISVGASKFWGCKGYLPKKV